MNLKIVKDDYSKLCLAANKYGFKVSQTNAQDDDKMNIVFMRSEDCDMENIGILSLLEAVATEFVDLSSNDVQFEIGEGIGSITYEVLFWVNEETKKPGFNFCKQFDRFLPWFENEGYYAIRKEIDSCLEGCCNFNVSYDWHLRICSMVEIRHGGYEYGKRPFDEVKDIYKFMHELPLEQFGLFRDAHFWLVDFIKQEHEQKFFELYFKVISALYDLHQYNKEKVLKWI